MKAVSGIILAGGRNSRMGGADKAFLRVEGQSVVERTIAVLRQVCAQIIVASNTPEKYEELNVEITRDTYLCRGPLAGLDAALGRVRFPWAFVVACDMPFLRVEPILYLRSRLAESDAVVPWWEGDVEPLHAFYSARIRPQVGRLLREGSGAMRDLLRAIDVTHVPESEMLGVAGSVESFRNVNTPEDAARYEVHI